MPQTLALGVRNPEIDISTPLMRASQLHAAESQNALAGLQLEQAQDRRNALQQFQASGDPNVLQSQPDLFGQVIANRRGMALEERERFDTNLLRNAKGAQRIASISNPAERQAAWQEELDLALQEKRIDPAAHQRLSSSPPNDLVLGNIMKMGLTLEQAITLEKTEKSQALGNRALDALTGTPSAPAAGGAALPRGIRNRNPLNLEASKFTQGLPGYKGSDGRFAQFETVEQGVAAADRLLQSYGKQGLNTLQSVIAKWSPPTENNTAAYIASVAKDLGIAPDALIDLADAGVRSKLLDAMAKVETGQPIQVTPKKRDINLLTRIAAMPTMPAEVRAVATKVLENELASEKPTDEMKEYRLAQQQGETRSFTDWKTSMKKAGATSVNVNTGAADLSKATENTVQASIIKSQDQLARLNDIRTGFKPEFLTLPFRAGMKATEIKSWLGRDLSDGERQSLTEFATAKRRTINNVNRILNELSGAAVSPQEAIRIRASQPDAGDGLFDGDDPVSFKAKLDESTKDVMRALARNHYVLKNGLPQKPWEVMGLDQVDDLINERGNALLAEMQKANPQAKPEDLQAEVRLRLQQEFGIGFEGAK